MALAQLTGSWSGQINANYFSKNKSMVSHWLNGHEFEQIPGDREGQRSLAYFSPLGHKELDTLNNTQLSKVYSHPGLYTLSVFSDILKHLQFLCIIA